VAESQPRHVERAQVDRRASQGRHRRYILGQGARDCLLPDGSRKVLRERSGGHRRFGPTVGQAVEDCIKAAETDATKRAFVTFGNIFGLALYDRQQRNVGTLERRQVAAPSWSQLAAIDEGFDPSGPDRQTTSQRAIAAAPRPAANGKDHSRLPY